MKTIRINKQTIAWVFLLPMLLTSFGSNSLPIPIPTPIPPQSKNIKLALLLDTSSSMDGLIDQAKAQLWKIVNELAKASKEGTQANVEIALYEYGNDRLLGTEGYIKQVLPLSNDLDDV